MGFDASRTAEPDLRAVSPSQLRAHSGNSNRMPDRLRAKLREQIERFGHYAPLIVRPHPDEPHAFEVLDGHHRLLILRELGYETVHCIVWPVTDVQARIFLASLNRLRGSEVPELRAALLDELAAELNIDDMKALLPESDQEIEALAELRDLGGALLPATPAGKSMSVLQFVVEPDDARMIEDGLTTVKATSDRARTQGEALTALVKEWSACRGR